jgi:hypothetical protein
MSFRPGWRFSGRQTGHIVALAHLLDEPCPRIVDFVLAQAFEEPGQ